MKRLTMTALLCICGCLISIHAQTTSHIAFRGAPLQGTVSEYAAELCRQGYTMKDQQANLSVLSGKFTGRKATIYVAGTKSSHTVWKVRVALPAATSWDGLKAEYQALKEAFTAKYGGPSLSYEFFSRPYHEGDGKEMAALRNGKCTYLCTFDVPGGTIWMRMERQGSLSINYEDSANTTLRKEESQVSIIEDL